MSQEKTTITNSASLALASIVKDYFQLIKFTLSFMVVFSTVISYLIATDYRNPLDVLLLFLAGMLITGSANTINQVAEKDTDALMKRTARRPVASGRMTVAHATSFAAITGITGLLIMLLKFNWQSSLIGLVSLFIYGFIYTPLKKVNSIAVLVGGLPGALPCLIGWVASYYDNPIVWTGGWVLFAIQFIWQFPHFWAIAWIAHQDYSKAGFKLLPADKGPTKFTAVQTIMYSTLMLPIGVLPYYYNVSGITSLWILMICNLTMIVLSIRLYVKMDAASARWVMFSSYFYLAIVFIALLVDKVHEPLVI
ncbi:MAG: heme o synthase [Ferruginibacter sp.]